MAGKKKKEEAPEIPPTPQEEQAARLSGIKVGDTKMINLFKLANEYQDIEYDVFLSGFPAMDRALSPSKPGIPRGRHIEIATTEPNIGKSTLTMQIVAAGQQQGLAACLAEPEATHTEGYLNLLRVVTRPDPSRPDIYPLRIMRPEWDFQNESSILHSAEMYLDAFGEALNMFDIAVMDSAAALCPSGDMLKDADENALVGGISKLLHAFFRKHTRPRATVLWVNQLLDKVGGFSPGGGTPKATVGGKAIPFYSSMRIFGSRIESIKAPNEGDDPIGFRVKWELKKNKCGPQDRAFVLPYLHGEGYSVPYATFEYAVAKKVIQQTGAWYQFPTGDLKKDPRIAESFGYLRTQGKIPFYETLRERDDTMAAILAVMRGEDPEDLRAKFEKQEEAESEPTPILAGV